MREHGSLFAGEFSAVAAALASQSSLTASRRESVCTLSPMSPAKMLGSSRG